MSALGRALGQPDSPSLPHNRRLVAPPGGSSPHNVSLPRPRHVAAASSVAPTNLALTRTAEVVDYHSPADVVERKRKELAAIGPGGIRQALFFLLWAPFVWLSGLISALPLLIKGRGKGPPALEPPFPLHEEWVQVNGVRLHCVSPGKRNPGKPLMLFVHGFPELWYSWRYQMEEFAKDYDVVAVDQRGYNDSDKPSGIGSYRIAQLAADVEGLVKALGHTRCTLVAHDWGGCIAWVVAGMYGSRLLDRLIVMGLPHVGVSETNMDWGQRKRSSYMLLFQVPLLPEAFLTSDGAAVLGKFFLSGPTAVRNRGAMTAGDVAWYKAAILKQGAATAMLNYYRAFLRTITLANQPGDDAVWRAMRTPIDVPTLLLHGEEDTALGVRLLQGAEAAFDPAAGGVEIKLLKGCSHWVQQDFPLQVNGLMRDWLKRQDARGK